ncbi:uncharacterized protein LOC121423197 [Lytechinus variegatus]|uniref:uncharacterized protein LOC121423197 n=1 Tax=Lytechinus variegatus TaxID=7654 RepID=UPI001BB1AC03|nr:uncharacterized protein LOC121423197 [Lytechinus variegatus]
MQMKQLNKKCSAEKTRIKSQRPVSPSSIQSGYSLYSTDTDDQVMSTHRGLDRCAALLANMMESDGSESIPTKLERGVKVKQGGMSHRNQHNKLTAKQKCPVAKNKSKAPSTQKKSTQSGSLKDKKQTGRRSFNQKLISSTPNHKQTILSNGERKKQGRDRMQSKDIHQEKTEVVDKVHLRIPARVSPGKENFPLSKQHSQGMDGQGRFIETYDVTPKVLNENVIRKTRVKAEAIRNPIKQHPGQKERPMEAKLDERPHHYAGAPKTESTLQPRYAKQEQQFPKETNGQTGDMSTGNYLDPNAQPWVSCIDIDRAERTPGNEDNLETQGVHHQHLIHQQQHPNTQDQHTQGYVTTGQPGTSTCTWNNSRMAPGVQPSRTLDSKLDHGVGHGPVNHGLGTVQTTQSILRDLVGKLQRMNESQIQTPQAQLSHPSGNAMTQNDTSHTQQQAGQESKDFHRKGVDYDARDQESKIQDTISMNKNFPKHSQLYQTSMSANHGTRLEASDVGMHDTDLQNGAEQLEPVRDSGQSCDPQPTNQSTGSVVTQMQRISPEIAEDPMDTIVDRKTGNSKPRHASRKSPQAKGDVGVQTPPLSSRPPAVLTGSKGSNALWDQVRTLRYITKELHCANIKIGDVQTQELLSELEEVIETLPFTSLDRDLQTEISLALQPIRSENSQLRRRLRIANQQLRQIQLQIQTKESSQSGVSLEALTLQSLNVNLQKQVEELQSETERQARDITELRASVDTLTTDKHNMQDVYKKMDNDLKEKRKGWTLETSALRQEITKLKSQLESESHRTEAVEKEKGILRQSVKQRDSEIKRLQQMTRNMQGIISSVAPGKSLKSSLPGESKESRLENWLENHQSSISTSNRNGSLNGLQTALRQCQRSPHDSLSSYSLSSSQGDHSTKHSSPNALNMSDWRISDHQRSSPHALPTGDWLVPDHQGSLDHNFVFIGGSEKLNPSQMDDKFGADGRYDDLDSTLVEDTLDGDGTAYMSIADPQIGNRKPYLFHTPRHRTSRGGGIPSWVEKEVSPSTKSERQHVSHGGNAHISDSLGRTGYDKHSSPSTVRSDSRLSRRTEHSERDLGKIFNAAEVGSVVSESTISSIASQYEAQFQVGLSKLDDDIARLQENLKGLVKR